jgi:hypothetical protein
MYYNQKFPPLKRAGISKPLTMELYSIVWGRESRLYPFAIGYGFRASKNRIIAGEFIQEPKRIGGYRFYYDFNSKSVFAVGGING